jgi:hypothetical protein
MTYDESRCLVLGCLRGRRFKARRFKARRLKTVPSRFWARG